MTARPRDAPQAHGEAGAEPWLGRLLGRLCLACASRPRETLAVVLALSLLAGAGMVRLETEANLLDIMPEGNEHTAAARNASQEFRGFYDFVTVFYEIDESKCEAVSAARLPNRLSPAACGNVTDEAYVRAMEEVWQFGRARLPAAQYAIDLAGIVKTVNWTNSGYTLADPKASLVDPLVALRPGEVGRPVDRAFRMPGTDPVGEAQYEAAWRGANAADDSVQDVVAPTWKAGRTIFFFDPEAGHSRVELGRAVYAMVDAYDAAVRACDADPKADGCVLDWNVFKPGLMVRGVSSQDAHASDVTQGDAIRLAPWVALALVGILFVSFRDLRMVVVAGATLVGAFAWAAGLMGYLGIPLSALNLTIVPMILGVGVDYAIHMVAEYLNQKGQGRTDRQAFRRAGSLCGLAMLVATVTTVGGLLLMTLSPSVLMGQLAVVGSIALTVCFVLALTLIPALLSALAPRAPRRAEPGSRLALRLARWVGSHRALVVVLLLAATAAAGAAASGLRIEALGDPQLNYPRGDRVRDDTERINELFFGGREGTQSNYLIVEGDLTQPDAHRFLDRLTANLEADPVIQGFNTASLTRVVRAWVNIDQGTPDALAGQFVLGNAPVPEVRDAQYPKTQQDIRATLDAIFASPFANFMTILLSPDGYDIGMVSFDTNQGLEYEDTAEVWEATERVLEQTRRETGVRGIAVHQFGNSPVSYLFITEELPWARAVGAASFVLVTLLILAMTRSWRATLATACIMAVTGIWWLGTLPPLGVGLSVGLMLPLVFISAIGSDNAVHLIWNLERLPDAHRVYRHVGKAIVLTMATDVAAFLLFSLQTDLLARRTMLATASSVTVMLAATLLIVPLFYPPDRPGQAARFASASPP